MANPDILVALIVVYVGEDHAAWQQAAIVSSSSITAELIYKNDFLVQRFVNGIVDKLRQVQVYLYFKFI